MSSVQTEHRTFIKEDLKNSYSSLQSKSDDEQDRPREEEQLVATTSKVAKEANLVPFPVEKNDAIAVLEILSKDNNRGEVSNSLTTISSLGAMPSPLAAPSSSTVSIIMGEEDSKVENIMATTISDPIEGHDSEFDIELSSASSIHSLSISSGSLADESHFENSESSNVNSFDSSSMARNDDKDCILRGGGGEPIILSTNHHGTLYGKMVKSIQKSIRKIFHCGRENAKHETCSESSLPSSAECFLDAPPSHSSFTNPPINVTTTDKRVIHIPIGSSNHSQSKIPLSTIHAHHAHTHNNNTSSSSPITSVISSGGIQQQTATNVHIHKTLLIDVSYTKPLLCMPSPLDVGKKCLVLDLDETLVHSTFQPVQNADLIVPVHLGEGMFQPIYVCKRPGVDEFLRSVSQIFEVVLFTASLSNYADPVIDFLDPTGGIRFRLYREDCLQFQGLYIKDLSRLGRDLDQILIIDNSPASYSMQPQNALGCRSWFKDPLDRELQDRLLPMLLLLKDSISVSQWRSENLESIETPYLLTPIM